LDFISQFTTDIQHILGSSNIVADALSRIEVEDLMKQTLNYTELAADQVLDEELQTLTSKSTAFATKTRAYSWVRSKVTTRLVDWNNTIVCHRQVAQTIIRHGS
jgi:hypothetical protein